MTDDLPFMVMVGSFMFMMLLAFIALTFIFFYEGHHVRLARLFRRRR